jgi:hypothetical protein
MAHVELTPEEARLLREALESYLADLRMEIAGTDSASFREKLKHTRAVLQGVVPRLSEPA